MGGGAEQLLDLLGQRLAEVADLAASLEAPDDLGRGADADVAVDGAPPRAAPGLLVGGVERAGRDLGRQRAAVFASESRRRPKKPLRSGSSAAVGSSPKSSAQVLDTVQR